MLTGVCMTWRGCGLRWVLLLGVGVLVSCTAAAPDVDSGPVRRDGGQPVVDASVPPDGSLRIDDAGHVGADGGSQHASDGGGLTPRRDGGSGSADAGGALPDDGGTSLLDAGSRDAGLSPADGGASPLSFGPVQCRSDEDCGGGSCNAQAPGGICDCGGTCPSGTACDFGACIRACDDDADCSLGMRCLTSGRCAIRSCTTDGDCPVPYVCGAVGCRRPDCTSSCLSGMVCVGALCMEP